MYRKHVGRALILALMLSGATSMNAQRITRQFKNVPLKTVLTIALLFSNINIPVPPFITDRNNLG